MVQERHKQALAIGAKELDEIYILPILCINRLGQIKMEKTSISLVVLGAANARINTKLLKSWRSSIFEIRQIKIIDTIEDATGSDWQYTDAQLTNIIEHDETTDFTLALINGPLENNYYMRRVSENIAVLSFYEIANEIRLFGFSLESYIIRNVYELDQIFALSNYAFQPDVYRFAHHDTRGCLFDMNADKRDLIFSLHKPSLCHSCETRVRQSQLDSDYLKKLKSELKRIKKPLFYRVMDFVKRHPLMALTTSFFFATLAGIAANKSPGFVTFFVDFSTFMLK